MKALAIIAYGLTIGVSAYCQGNLPQQATDQIDRFMPKPSPKAPNVAELGKYGDYKPQLFTGIPQISIPLYDVESGSLKVPITLNYHASGVRMKDIAGWVGLGWSVSAGGQVSRSVGGKPDEQDYATTDFDALPIGMSICDPEDYNLIKDLSNGARDAEPDMFSYAFPGKSGKFLSGNAGAPPYLVPYEPINISFHFEFQQIEIVDENGTLHRFGKDSNGTSAIDATGTNGNNHISAWHLMEMVAANSDDKISFKYQDLGNISYNDENHSVTVTDDCVDTTPPPSNPFPPPPQGCPITEEHPTTNTSSVSSLVTQSGIDEIVTDVGRVKFVPVGGHRADVPASVHALDHIDVYRFRGDGSEQLIKTIKFNYTYFTKSGDTTKVIALKLDSVEVRNSMNIRVQRYQFTYYTNTFSWNSDNARDYWGFYNGKTSNTDLIPRDTILAVFSPGNVGPIVFGGADRNTNPAYGKEGVLKRIVYPTGGYTDFEYESNKYFDSLEHVVGGLRVTKITSKDDEGAPAAVKTYKYGLNESGYGVINFTLGQFSYSGEQLIVNRVCNGAEGQANLRYRVRTWYSNAAYQLGNSFESPVVYPYVTEYIGERDGANNGRTVYEYDNGAPNGPGVPLVIPGSTKYFKDNFSWKNGHLTQTTVYDSANNTLSDQIVTYDNFKSKSKVVGFGAIKYRQHVANYCPTDNACEIHPNELIDQLEFRFQQFTQNSGAIREASTITYSYVAGDLVNVNTQSITNTYDTTKLQVVSTKITKSDGSNMVTLKTYPFHLPATSGSTGNALGVYMLNQKNVLSSPIEEITYLESSTSTDQRVVSGHVTSYRQSEDNASHVVVDTLYFFESKIPVDKANVSQVTINSGSSGLSMNQNYKPRIAMVKYDAFGNLKQVNKIGDHDLSYLYGYGNTLPVAEVKNAPLGDVFYMGFEHLPVSSTIEDVEINLNAMTAKAGTQYYKGDYVLEFAPANVSRAYVVEYWYLEGSVWKFKTTTYTSPSATLSDGTAIDEVRVRPVDAEITTYTYSPMIGLTSINPPNNVIAYYEYDAFGRLQVLRDQHKNILKHFRYNYKRSSGLKQ